MSKIFGERWRDKSEKSNMARLDTFMDRSRKKKGLPKLSVAPINYLQVTLLCTMILSATSIAFGKPVEWTINVQTKQATMKINYK